jgi:fluoride exporter
MMSYLIVFLGGGLGAAARHGVNVLSVLYLGTRYPVGTFCINVLGSMLVGILAGGMALRINLPADLRLFLVTGIIGGFTTFSAFSLETGLLYQRGETVAAVSYATASVVCSVLAMFAGMSLARHLVTH